MLHLGSDTFRRPVELRDGRDPAVLYARTYLLTRLIVGALGIGLPFLLLGVDALFVDGSITARESLSAYYHSGARDEFVGVLSVIGVLLMTYLAAQPRTWDFWLSLVAGAAAIGVAVFPDARPRGYPGPPTELQQALGERLVAGLHFTFAGTFILGLSALCFVFGHRDARHDAPRRAALHRGCAWVILVAVAWAGIGRVVDLDIGWLTSLYVAEVTSTWAFGLSWFVKGIDLLRALMRPHP